MDCPLIAEIPTHTPLRVLRAYQTEGGGLWLGEYERSHKSGEFHPTHRAVQIGARQVSELLDALQQHRALAVVPAALAG